MFQVSWQKYAWSESICMYEYECEWCVSACVNMCMCVNVYDVCRYECVYKYVYLCKCVNVSICEHSWVIV